MDHIYDIFSDIEPVLESEERKKEDEILAYQLSAMDYLVQGNLEQAKEVFLDYKETIEEEDIEE